MLKVYIGNCCKYFFGYILISMKVVNFGHVCLAFMLVIQGAVGYPGGAPLLACKSMFPSGHKAAPQAVDPPFRIRLPVKAYTPGATVKVTLEATDGYFKGVFMQAREVGCQVNYTRTVGVFQTTDYSLKTAHCFGIVHSAVSHSTNSRKRSVSVYWTAPTISSGHVVIRATVVKESKIFWINVESQVMVDLESLDTPKCLSPTVSPVPDELADSPYDREQVVQGPVTSATTSNPYSHVLSLQFLLLICFIVWT